MGEVYAGHRVDADLQQIVAIKIIAARLDSPVLRTIFFHERDALARLHHAHIARLLDGGVTPETAKQAIAAGADVLVAGTSVFKGGPSAYAANIQALRG